MLLILCLLPIILSLEDSLSFSMFSIHPLIFFPFQKLLVFYLLLQYSTKYEKLTCLVCHPRKIRKILEDMGRGGGAVSQNLQHTIHLSPNLETFKEPKNQFQGIDSTSQCSLAVRYVK
jgi:hypothetical protein